MTSYRTLCRRCVRYALIGRAYRRWYRVARAVIRRLVDYRYEQPWSNNAPYATPQQGYPWLCDLVAITSPRVYVKRNLRFAWGEFTGQPRPGDLTRSTRVALDHYYRTGEIRGPKTSRFAQVLRGSDNIVVVDTWIARALSIPDKQARNKSTQELAERVIDSVAIRLHREGFPCLDWLDGPVCNWKTTEVQAMIWAGMIRTHYNKGKIPLYRTEDVGLYHEDQIVVCMDTGRTLQHSILSDVPF